MIVKICYVPRALSDGTTFVDGTEIRLILRYIARFSREPRCHWVTSRFPLYRQLTVLIKQKRKNKTNSPASRLYSRHYTRRQRRRRRRWPAAASLCPFCRATMDTQTTGPRRDPVRINKEINTRTDGRTDVYIITAITIHVVQYVFTCTWPRARTPTGLAPIGQQRSWPFFRS